MPQDHLLRAIDRFVDLSEVRRDLAPFYSPMGRPSIDPELLIRMLLVGYCVGVRSERRLCEEVHLNLAYRWFCRLGLDADVPDHSTFSKNRHGRFRESDLLRKLFEAVGQSDPAVLSDALPAVLDDLASLAAGASYYGVLHPPDFDHHLTSTRFDPAQSPALEAFLAHVDVVVTIHGYGRVDLWTSILASLPAAAANAVATRRRTSSSAPRPVSRAPSTASFDWS